MKTILITGASSGVGKACALHFLTNGWVVGLMARREEPLREIAEAFEHAHALPGDVTKPTDVTRCFDAFAEATGKIDVLFNNAGIFVPAADIDETPIEDWDRAVAVNLTGMFLCARAAFGQMRKQGGGRIINNGSVSAHVPREGAVTYTTTKHAITGMTKQLSLDGRALNICCGQIDIGNAESEMVAAMKAKVPDLPTMAVADVARTVLHMADLPLDTNMLTATIMANRMPYVGRG